MNVMNSRNSREVIHRIVDHLELEGSFKAHLVEPPCNEQGHHRGQVLQRPLNLPLNVSRDGTSAISLDSLFQCITTLIVKNRLSGDYPKEKKSKYLIFESDNFITSPLKSIKAK